MSEKRFKKGINLSCIDTKTGKTYWYACNLCGLLNKLFKENEQLHNQKVLANAFIVEKGLELEFVKWSVKNE